MDNVQEVTVKIEAPDDALVSRAFSIMKERIQQRCQVSVVKAEDNAQIILDVGSDLPPEAYRVDQAGAAVRIAGGSPLGLLYGIGKFLRTSRYDGEFNPSTWRGTSVPQGSLRGMYFASHFHNWYHEAPETEITRYVEDLALWGVNAILVAFPAIDLEGWDDPETGAAVAMVQKYARITKALGLSFGIGANNTLFRALRSTLRAVPLPDPTHRRGNSGNPICPSNPEGHAYILENIRQIYQLFTETGLDFVTHWPYDEGGCACENCQPWGSNGYLKLSRDLTQVGRSYFPGLKSILSTWMFDTPPEGEWQGLSEAMHQDPGWVDAILADSHEDFPRYPLDVEVPGACP